MLFEPRSRVGGQVPCSKRAACKESAPPGPRAHPWPQSARRVGAHGSPPDRDDPIFELDSVNPWKFNGNPIKILDSEHLLHPLRPQKACERYRRAPHVKTYARI